MDPQSLSALLQTMAEQQENARQQNAALGNLIGQLQLGQQGQTELLARLVAGQAAQPNGAHPHDPPRHRNRQLVDPRGVGKPSTLTGDSSRESKPV